jgi:hypothetical protein
MTLCKGCFKGKFDYAEARYFHQTAPIFEGCLMKISTQFRQSFRLRQAEKLVRKMLKFLCEDITYNL